MKESDVEQENKIDWYISHKPIEKYLNIARKDNLIISKFVNRKSGKNSPQRKK